MVPIGRAFRNTELRVVMVDGLVPVIAGSSGRLVLCGGNVGLGYINRGSATRSRFNYDWLANDGRLRCYDSGDHAHTGPDGVVQYEGRADHQLKVGASLGQSHHLGEKAGPCQAITAQGEHLLHVVENQELLRDLKVDDEIISMKIVDGAENLVNETKPAVDQAPIEAPSE